MHCSDTDAVMIAIEMEKRGAEFYRSSARCAKNEDTRALLTALAADEDVHENDFRRLLAEVGTEEYSFEDAAFLEGIAADIAFPEGLMGMLREGLDNRRAYLEHAVKSEQTSIRFYTGMLIKANDAHARQVFRDIVATEQMHLAKLRRALGTEDPA